jgi:MFS transporter, DHA2 family, multidrug resistance protein
MASASSVPARAGAVPNKWLVTAAVTFGTLMGTVDASIVNVALPSIQASFGVSITEVTWVSTAYLIALVIILPLTGWLASVVGRKLLYQTCLLVFVSASIMAGLAPSLPFLIAARVLQGLGAGALGPTEQAILGETFPPEQRGLATGLYALVVVLGPTIGPLIGGLITDNYTWRWIFFINLPIGLIGFLMVAAFVIEPAYIKAQRTTIDAVGITLMAVGLSALLVVLEQGYQWDWFTSPLVWGFALTAGSCLLMFVLWELFGTESPAVDLRLLANRSFAAAWVSVGLLGFGLLGALLLQSLFLQEVLGYTATQTGLAFMPRGLATMVMSPLSGLLLNRLGPRVMASTGLGLVCTAVALMSRWTLDSGRLQTTVPLVINGVGLSMMFIPLFTSALAAADRRRLTGAAGLVNLQLQLGASFGTAILATMIENGIQVNHARLVEQTNPTNPAYQHMIAQLTGLMMARGGADPTLANTQALAAVDSIITAQASVLSFEHAFQMIVIVLLCMYLCIPFLRRPPRGPAAGH